MNKPLNDLLRIASAGGGFKIDAGQFEVNDLIRIASAASTNGARITIINALNADLNDLLRIASAGQGSVVFE